MDTLVFLGHVNNKTTTKNMDIRKPPQTRTMALNSQTVLQGSYGNDQISKGEPKNRREEKPKGRRESRALEKGFAKLSRIPDKAIRVIFQLLEPFPCTSVAFAITHPRFYKVRKSYYTPVKALYCYDPPLTIRTPTQLLYVVIKDFMGSERHFCYARRKFIPWSRRGMTIEEKRRDRCPENSTPNTCGLCCGDNVGPLLSD